MREISLYLKTLDFCLHVAYMCFSMCTFTRLNEQTWMRRPNVYDGSVFSFTYKRITVNSYLVFCVRVCVHKCLCICMYVKLENLQLHLWHSFLQSSFLIFWTLSTTRLKSPFDFWHRLAAILSITRISRLSTDFCANQRQQARIQAPFLPNAIKWN